MVKLLIAEDERDIRLVLERSLEALSKNKFSIEACANGEAAIERLLQNGIDVFLTDVRMPGMGGLETIRRVREFSSIPIIVLSAYGDRKSIEEATEAGANRYFVKPPDYYRLAATVIGLARPRAKPSLGVELHYRRLEKLREQAAWQGLNTPPEILIEIEDLEARLDK